MDCISDFPLLANNPGLHYLDSAATAQKPKVVLDAMREYYETSYANPHRGAYTLSVRATELYHTARERIAGFFGLHDPACLIFTRGTTEAINLVAGSWGRANVQAGDEIVITALEHHANFVPWQQLALERGAKLHVCSLTPDGMLYLDHLSELLNSKTHVLAFNHVSNVLGTINPVAEICAIARAKSPALIVCDGAQSAPHLRIDFEGLGVDIYAFSGHKMCGPMGIGGLIGKRDVLDGMPVYQTGGDMIEFVFDERATWNDLPYKFEAGTPNAVGAVGLAAAVEYLEKIGMDAIMAHERIMTKAAYRCLSEIEGIHIYGPGVAQRSGAVSFTLSGVRPHDLASILDGEGVCIRAGHHCAQPLMRRMNVTATARASFYMYNNWDDINALVNGILKAKDIFNVTVG